jgi:alpha-mannosidase
MFHDIRWTSQKIAKYLEVIKPLVYKDRSSIPPFRLRVLQGPDVEPPVAPEIEDKDWQVIPPKSYWGGADVNFVLRSHFKIPGDWQAFDNIALYLPIGIAGDFSHPEALVYIDGVPYAAIDHHHQEVSLPSTLQENEPHLLALHGWTGSLSQGKQPALFMGDCALVTIDQPTRDFISLARVALGVADHLDENDPVRSHLLNTLYQAFILLDLREPLDETFYESLDLTHQSLVDGVNLSGSPIDVDITAAGHAHLDVAWLWTLGQTRRKAGRTFYNVICLMEEYPDFRFVQSQPQLYEFIRQDFPDLFDGISKKIENGQWEAIGGMWVEADCNLAGGESLVRQFLLGRSYYRLHFGKGVESPVLWLPDVFGFPWCLPQLIKDAGLDYFFTIKIGWSQYNRMPFDSFWWQGLDGTRVLTHFSTTKGSDDTFVSTYNAKATPDEVLTTWRNFQQKDWGKPGKPPPLLMVYGYGDGGGGPTREMIENVHTMEHFPGVPRVRMGKVAEFFRDLETEVGDRLPVWNGELYLEYHRGTYTTQARSKRANRKSEFMLHDVEYLVSLADYVDPKFDYPRDDLRRIWELVCLNQFHDILPGTSIGEVYQESYAQYTEVAKLANQIKLQALRSISGYIGGDLLIINPTSFCRTDYAFMEGEIPLGSTIIHSDGTRVNSQKVSGGYLLDAGEVPPYSVVPLLFSETTTTKQEKEDIEYQLTAANGSLENRYLRVSFNADGDIVSLYNKILDREMIPFGAVANQFLAFEDRPKTPDAWEIDIYYDKKVRIAEPAESIEVIENGEMRVVLEVRRRILNSRIIQRISLAKNSYRLDFDTTIDWRERNILLKVAFPIEVLSPFATFDIQWGDIQRPTSRNTSWEWAKFEVPAQKWVDLSEGGYGVSLLNDCKYGFDIQDNVMRMTLLRSPTYPDPTADLGEHQFAYSLLPHGDDWKTNTIIEAYSLNDPLIAFRPQQTMENQHSLFDSFVRVDQPNVIIETIKGAEDGRGLIVRLFESQRKRSRCVLSTGFQLAEAWKVNILEENQELLDTSEDYIQFDIKPYQILSFRLLPKSNTP